MDEDAYREIYNEINQTRCVFEKALNNRRCDCEKKHRFNLATREGVGCVSVGAQKYCSEFLNTMRQNARFSLRVITVEGPMPHNKELQVQAGGCIALQKLLLSDELNIYALVKQAREQYDSIENFPYSEIVREIVKYKSRPKRNRH